jgi:hypothetical protein
VVELFDTVCEEVRGKVWESAHRFPDFVASNPRHLRIAFVSGIAFAAAFDTAEGAVDGDDFEKLLDGKFHGGG